MIGGVDKADEFDGFGEFDEFGGEEFGDVSEGLDGF